MAHDAGDRPEWFTVRRPEHSAGHPDLEWDDPATVPSEVAAGDSHPLFIGRSGRPLESEPSRTHPLALPQIDRAGDGSLR
jgi:hypothetical protein